MEIDKHLYELAAESGTRPEQSVVVESAREVMLQTGFYRRRQSSHRCQWLATLDQVTHPSRDPKVEPRLLPHLTVARTGWASRRTLTRACALQ